MTCPVLESPIALTTVHLSGVNVWNYNGIWRVYMYKFGFKKKKKRNTHITQTSSCFFSRVKWSSRKLYSYYTKATYHYQPAYWINGEPLMGLRNSRVTDYEWSAVPTELHRPSFKIDRTISDICLWISSSGYLRVSVASLIGSKTSSRTAYTCIVKSNKGTF